MPIDKHHYVKGMRLTGATHLVEDPRRARIQKGQFMTAPGGTLERAPLPPDLAHFEQAAAAADQMALYEHTHAAAIREIAKRLEAVRAGINEVTKRSRQ